MATIGKYPATIDLVREFHEHFNIPIAKQLTTGDASLRRARVLFIAQELAELCQALGVSIEMEVKSVRLTGGEHNPKAISNGMLQRVWVAPAALCYSDNLVDMVGAADALGDLDVTVQGANLVLGIPGGLVAREVHDSNMSKLGADGEPIHDENGKIVKGPNYRPPDIHRVLTTFDPKEEL